MRRFAIIPTLAAVVSLAACGGGDGAGDALPPNASPAGPSLSIGDARGSHLRGPLLVSGYLYGDDSGVRLCSGFRESYPPQCVQPSLVVEDLDPEQVGAIVKGPGAFWTDSPVQLLGVVRNGVLRVSHNASA
jgi:hypothetical protein